DAEEQARALMGAGVASAAPGGVVYLRDDVRRALALEPARRRALADALGAAALDPLGRAHVALARGRPDEARERFLGCVRAARDAGDPERAAAVGLEALEALEACAARDAREPRESPRGARDGAELTIRLAVADALRASARESRALALLDGDEGVEARVARAELARLAGALGRAADEAGALDHPEAALVRARLALGRGELDAALRALDGVGAGDPARAARADEVRALVALGRGEVEEAWRAARDAAASASRVGSMGALARAASVEGAVLWARGRIEEAAARFERAFELAERAGERYAAASYLVNVGLGRLERGAPGPAIEALREGARRLSLLGRRRDATRALYNLANAAALVGDDALARGAAARARDWARAHGDGAAAALASVVESELSLRAGKLDAAVRALDEAARDAADVTAVTVGARRAAALAIRGDLDAAEAALAAIAGAPADRAAELERAVAIARVALARGDAFGAADAAAAALARAQEAGWEGRLRAALCAAEALERAGRAEESRAALSVARTLLDEAAATLPPPARARLRAVPAYQRALTAAPAPIERAAVPRHRALARHAKRLVREARLSRLYEAIVDAAVELADAERGFLVRRGPDGGVLVASARAFGAALVGEQPSRSIAARALDAAGPLVAVDALEDERLGAAASVHQLALRSVLAVPLPGAARALVLDDRLRPAAFGADVVEVILDLAEIAAGAIERAEAQRAQREEARRLARAERRLAARVQSAEEELSALRRRVSDAPAFAGIVRDSAAMRRVLSLVERVAPSDAPVLVCGESGTGKELVARAIHAASARREGPWVGENCSAIPETLLESTLFGHVRGAFTGADRARRGLFEIADGGTLFLDEIGEMSEAMQAKLLRVLQDGELRPIGGETTRKVDVRLVAATHRDLLALVEEGRFRRDLYYRIAVVSIELPPLRERPEDIPALVQELLARHAGGRSLRVEPAAMRALRAYRWPGNVRELENELRRALVLAEDVIDVSHLTAAAPGEPDAEPRDELDLKGRVAALERRLIRRALDECGGNQTRAAARLGVSRFGLQKMIKRLEV
ncbi:MAG: sigma 54-interacting transcriptional regulator, partial [Sandaracinaceae bacterium]|nr:sigma 54-interacting transcriptional regulator [Sandaracinaceae bacterium]